MKPPFQRALCAALLLTAVPTAASAAQPDASPYPAMAAVLAIPGEARVPRADVPMRGRFVLVDAASATMYMFEDGRVTDSMRVIVGKPSSATPALNSSLNYATLNPYWNVPTDLARTIIAPRVLEQGASYLQERGYQVVSGFTPNARVLPVESVDWAAVADGSARVYVRQLPSQSNSMGRMKFDLADGTGIFLHDTPKKALFDAAQRNLSNGCVRLEDAPRFARWVLGRDPVLTSAAPEQQVPLPRSIPIAITYLDEQARTQIAALR